MHLKRLLVERCRRFSSFSVELDTRQIIQGKNGSGKSTLLEAIRILSVGKSFRTSRFDELVSFNEPHCRLQAEIDPEGTVEFFYGQPFAADSTKERVMKLNGQEIGLLDYLGTLPSILFTPADIEIALGSPQDRRKFLDGILWQVSSDFRQNQLELGRVLRERSALLFLVKIHRASPDELHPWNELLQGLTEKIRASRQELIDFLQEKVEQMAKASKQNGQYQLKYIATEGDSNALIEQEIKLSQNLYGPHRDELDLFLDDRLIRRFASRGQARTLVALLKIAEAAFLQEKRQVAPLVLLDDIFSELDDQNAAFLLEQQPKDSQLIISTIEPLPLVEKWSTLKLK